MYQENSYTVITLLKLNKIKHPKDQLKRILIFFLT